MESELLPDKKKNTPPVPIKTYQWEDLRRARKGGGYPWTHLSKIPLEGEITAQDIILSTTPSRSMSRDISRSRTSSPAGRDMQRILNLDSSPGSSRKHSEEGKDEGIHIPNFSKEVSLDSEDDAINQAVKAYVTPETQTSFLMTVEKPKNVSPKSILKHPAPDQQQYIGVTETREKTKCCHPLVNKIKHLADKTLQKLERSDVEKSPSTKRKKNEDIQEIRQLKTSPGSRRHKFGAIKLGDSDEMSKSMSVDTPPLRKKKEHVYEDIEECKERPSDEKKKNVDCFTEQDVQSEQKSVSSQDPGLVADENTSLKSEEHVMEKIHKIFDTKEALLLDEEMDPEESNVDEIFQNQVEDTRPKNDSPNITITEIVDDDTEITEDQITTAPIEISPSPSPRELERKRTENESMNDWSKPNSDHEYEIIEKPPPNMVHSAPGVSDKPAIVKTDDELSSTTSLERKYLQTTSDDDEQIEDKENINDDKNEGIKIAEALQSEIEDRYFLNTPSTVSRTECEISTSQVDSSALENLPLKRDNRTKTIGSMESKIQQRIKEGTGKLRTQAGKLKSKLQDIKSKQFTMPERPKINFRERTKIKLPERPKISFPERPKFSLPDKRKFSLPDRSKFKKYNLSEKFSFGDRKFTMPSRPNLPKFNVPELPKFKLPERSKSFFPSLGKQREYKIETEGTQSSTDLRNDPEPEVKTYPRLFGRKKKAEMQKTSSSPTLNREDTPPPTFTFTRVKKIQETPVYIPDMPEQPREYGNLENAENYDEEMEERKHFDTTYDFDKLTTEYSEDIEPSNFAEYSTESTPETPTKHVINEIDNDEFFVRPRGISRENIQVREYLRDEIRQAFKSPKNVLAMMGSNSGMDDKNIYVNDPEIDDNEGYSIEDLNDRDDGYYTFPPVRPSRSKHKKKETEEMKYIDDSVNASMQFSEIDLQENQDIDVVTSDRNLEINDETDKHLDFSPITDLHSIHEYANDDVDYPDSIPIQSQTLPMPPKRKRKSDKNMYVHSSLTDIKNMSPDELWDDSRRDAEDIIVYRTEHEYIVPQAEVSVTEHSIALQHSPAPPRRNRSRSSRATSLCDDDRTSHGAESLTLDTHIHQSEDVDIDREIRHDSPGYATVDKALYTPSKVVRRSKSKTPPVRRRKSNSSERKYYTVGSNKMGPDRPPRKKSSTSLMTLDSFAKRSSSADLTQYVEIDEPRLSDTQKDLKSGEIVSKMKDRPLPPPPRPPRGPKREKRSKDIENFEHDNNEENEFHQESQESEQELKTSEDVIEIEVSTQTDPLPDDVDFDIGLDESLDVSISSSLRDIIDEDSILKGHTKVTESPLPARPSSRPEKSEKSLRCSDPKISKLSKASIGRTSPTVILVEKRVSSPTRINEREEMFTEASLTVQHIDIDESQIPDVPPLPSARGVTRAKSSKVSAPCLDSQTLERFSDSSRDVQVDNLVTQRLQVSDLDVGKLNVSELQASKIMVSDIACTNLQVSESDPRSGLISVSGLEFSPSVIDEIVKKFAEISQSFQPQIQVQEVTECHRPISREEHTQTDVILESCPQIKTSMENEINSSINELQIPSETTHRTEELPPVPPPPPRPSLVDDIASPPQRPPPPDLAPLLYSYLQDMTMPSSSFYAPRSFREVPLEFHESQHQSPPPPTRRIKRKPATPRTESSSDEVSRPHPSPRRTRAHEPTITEAGVQFLRVCQTSISRTLRNIFNSFMSYISGAEDKRDVQMALVIFLVLVAGLIMFGISDSRTVHHHHWEFFNPPDTKQ